MIVKMTKAKVIATIFWAVQGILPTGFLDGQSITSARALAEKCPGKFHQRVLLHHDNTLIKHG